MPKHDPEIMAKVDPLLEQQGEYLPLELLLAEGRLFYADYDAWRGGQLEHLQECLFGDEHSAQQLLLQAAAYCQALGFKPSPCHYRQWSSEQVLKFSLDSQWDSLFQTGYRKDDSQPQLDLFMDNIGNNLANDCRAALAERNAAKAAQILELLIKADLKNKQIDPLRELIEVAANWPTGDLDANQIRRLQEAITPLAQDLLRARANDFLTPYWRQAARQLQDRDPAQASWFWTQAQDWPAVRAGIEQLSDWPQQAELLMRHARACLQLKDNRQILLDLLQLSWRWPGRIPELIARLDGLYRHNWQSFQDSDCELEARDFPAWLLITLPGQASLLDAQTLAPLEPAQGFMELWDLVQAERKKLAPDQRARLKQAHPELLRAYLAGRN
ncbi:hypothetical protein D5125_00110 [Magnetovirga frankeli]|uniref:hypothetical protein n=1 Tax=Magnetovirga frankeli TaxID=947516 RepID=UPI001293D9EF|nr:hypothetical protein D5125_00110 [gamma proteobacterium SS-5]